LSWAAWAGGRPRGTRLQSTQPNRPQAPRLRMALGGGGGSGGSNNALQTARRAAAAGRYAEAVRAYDQAFGKGGPPDDLALEYYQVLAGTPDGWERARDGLRRVAGNSNSPADPARGHHPPARPGLARRRRRPGALGLAPGAAVAQRHPRRCRAVRRVPEDPAQRPRGRGQARAAARPGHRRCSPAGPEPAPVG